MLELMTKEAKMTDSDFQRISRIVYSHCGINLHGGKRGLVRSRLSKHLRALDMESFSEYIDYVENDETGRAFSNMIDSISTNLTSFFREPQHFEYLKDELLSNTIKHKISKSSRRIRAWSAGCSSGEEPYSIAITILDKLEKSSEWDVKILASDVSLSILDKAQSGVYSQQRIEPLSDSQRAKYLIRKRVDDSFCYQTSDVLKNIIQFAYLNLMDDFPFKGPLDFIFCRNVMIYFDKETQQRLIQKFCDVLSPGGILFTGHSESLTGIKHRFKYIRPTIYQKT